MQEPYILLLSINACLSIILKIFTHNRTCWCLRACVCVCERVDLLKIIFKQNVNNLTICCIPNPKRECACASDSGNCRQSAIATATAVIASGKQYRKQQQRKTLATLTHTRSTHIHTHHAHRRMHWDTRKIGKQIQTKAAFPEIGSWLIFGFFARNSVMATSNICFG